MTGSSIRWRSTGAGLALVGGLALAIRLLYLHQTSDSLLFDTPVLDARSNVEEGLRLASGIRAGGSEVPFWQPPLYSYFLGLLFTLFGEDYHLPRLVQAVLGAITCVSLFWLGHRAFSSPATGWLAACTAAIYGPFIYFEGELLPVGPAVCLNGVLLLTLLWAARGPGAVRWLLAGLLLACSGLLVANVFLFAPVVLLWALRFLPLANSGSRRRLVQAAAFCLGVALVVAPVTLRNRIAGGEWVLASPKAGINSSIGSIPGNNPDDDDTVIGREWHELVNRPQRDAGTTGRSAGSGLSEPLEYVGSLLHNTRLFWRGDEILHNLDPYYARTNSSLLQALLWKYGLAFPFGLIAPLALFGLGACLIGPLRRSPAGALLLLFTATYAFSVTLLSVTGRDRLPVVPVLLLFAASGLVTLFRQRGTRLALASALLLLLLFGTNRGVGAMNSEGDAYQHYWMGVAFQEREMEANALAQYRRAVKLDPAHEEALQRLASIYARQRRGDEAIGVGRQLLGYYPDRDDVRLDVADLLLKKAEYRQAIDFYEDLVVRRGDWAALHGRLAFAYLMSDAPTKAEAAYRRVLEIKPDSLLVRYQLAQLYLAHGNDTEALREYRTLVELQPDHVEVLCQLADLLVRGGGNEAEAERYLRAALLADSQSIPALRSMARLEARRGHYGAAIEHFSVILSLAPDEYQVHQELGKLYLETGQKDQARAAFVSYQRAVRRDRVRQIAQERTGKMVETMLRKSGQ